MEKESDAGVSRYEESNRRERETGTMSCFERLSETWKHVLHRIVFASFNIIRFCNGPRWPINCAETFVSFESLLNFLEGGRTEHLGVIDP